MDRCTQLVLHPLRNVQTVQLVVQEMAESAVVLPRVADDASDSIQNSLELVCGGLGCPSENGVAVVHCDVTKAWTNIAADSASSERRTRLSWRSQ